MPVRRWREKKNHVDRKIGTSKIIIQKKKKRIIKGFFDCGGDEIEIDAGKRSRRQRWWRPVLPDTETGANGGKKKKILNFKNEEFYF